MTLDEAKKKLKKARDLGPFEFYEVVSSVVDSLFSVQEVKLSVLGLAAYVRQEELGELECSRKGVYKRIESVYEEERKYLERKKNAKAK